MAAFYEHKMVTGLPSGVKFRFRPFTHGRTAMSSTKTRFHPYMKGNSLESQRNGSNLWTHYPSEHYYGINFTSAMEQWGHLSGYYNTSGAGPMLANALAHKDFNSFNVASQQMNCQKTIDLNILQNLCTVQAQEATRYPRSSSRKDRIHPFYSRKRVEPAEGMTRTRDKYRVVYTEKQKKELEQEYNNNKFITTEKKEEISEKLGLSPRQIKIWFQNRRAKERRDCRKNVDTEQTECENSKADENNVNIHSPNSLANVSLSTSCRFTGNEDQSEKRHYSSGLCRFTNNIFNANDIDINRFSSPVGCARESHNSVGQAMSEFSSHWSTSTNDTCSFIPSLDLSPLGGNINFGLGHRV